MTAIDPERADTAPSSPDRMAAVAEIQRAASAKWEADLRERLAAEVEAQRVVCPVHGIPDCSPLLNGCSIPNMLVRQRDADARIVRGSA